MSDEARRPRPRKNLRKDITPTKRKRIYERDDYTCQGPCGRRLPPGHPEHDQLSLDHRMPRSKGGRNDDDNLQTMCRDCNSEKGDSEEKT
jgi:5-methylcytosine-specific restriction endonuclease McrA